MYSSHYRVDLHADIHTDFYQTSGVCLHVFESGSDWKPLFPADCGEEKEDGTFTGAEELFGTTSESDTSTFHGFEDDELEEPAANSNGIPNRHR